MYSSMMHQLLIIILVIFTRGNNIKSNAVDMWNFVLSTSM
jgi:hypothetical protein